MKIIMISNALTPHQAPLCDAFDSATNCEFKFIEAYNIDKNTLPIGWRFLEKRDYLINNDEFISNLDHYKKEIINADAVIFGSIPYKYVKDRIKNKRLTFFYTERFYRNWKDLLKLPFHFFKFNYLFHHSCVKLLCASAFAYSDFLKLGCFKNRAYKWGYFTPVDTSVTEEELDRKNKSGTILIMWCARFLKLKHPELPIQLVARLKSEGYRIHLNMYGVGELHKEAQKLTKQLRINNIVTFHNNVPNEEIHKAMREHHIFLFTSDKNEGWGAVSNEAMSNGCVLVGSHSIGSVPYLIKNKINGLVFKSEDIESLYKKITYLLDNPNERENMSQEGLKTMRKVWSPENAALSFISLASKLKLKNERSEIATDGPCSKAEKYKNDWYNEN